MATWSVGWPAVARRDDGESESEREAPGGVVVGRRGQILSNTDIHWCWLWPVGGGDCVEESVVIIACCAIA